MRRAAITTIFAILATLQGAISSPAQDPAWNRYWTYEEGVAYLQGLAARRPDLLRMIDAGRSREGRVLWVAEISNLAAGPADAKPALAVDGGIHGNEISGTMVPLYLAGYLVGRQGSDPQVNTLLERRTFYIRPYANPDASERFLAAPQTPHQPRRNLRPTDDDQDGVVDEDPYEDLDGDGEIGLMRRHDPNGRWRPSPRDPRVMEEVPADAPPGGWTVLGLEGIDNDGDGLLNEDGPGGVDLARNFPARWNAAQGPPYPLSEPESRSMADFVLTRRNIAAVHHFHNDRNMLLFGLGPVGRGPDPEGRDESTASLDGVSPLPGREADLEACRVLARRAEEMLGCRSAPIGGAGQYVTWAYEHLGVWGILAELAGPSADGSIPPAAADAWIPWRPFRHPGYGDIEIGGVPRKTALRNPAPERIEEMCLKHARWAMHVADQLPDVRITSLRLRPLAVVGSPARISPADGENAFRLIPRRSVTRGLAWLEATVADVRMLPTASRQARAIGTSVPDRIEIDLGSGAELAGAGGPRVEAGNDGVLRSLGRTSLDLGTLEGHESRTVAWLVSLDRGEPAPATIRVVSEKGGTDIRTVRLHLDDADLEAK